QIAFEKAGILKAGVPCVVGAQQAEAWDAIVARADAVGAPLVAEGMEWQVWEEHGRLVFQDGAGLIDLPLPGLIGRHQVENAGMALAVLRGLGAGEAGCAAAMTGAVWPARLQRLRHGPLVEAAGAAELWLDGGHNPAAGIALAEALGRLRPRPLHLVCGMLNTKDVAGFLAPLAVCAEDLAGVDIPGEAATLRADQTVAAAAAAGLRARPATSLAAAVREIASADPGARILICGSLYLAGQVLRENG
ncbi:MAG: bifunctional folylpolyglutamate synthase/dihydrofolate synthase, partial [Rhodobacteraceae bacterium]|nr:bifunctional folylpolyglutamate synthase/dihydrofolate synthase [Paracoccaceae bacterium]